MSDTNPYASPVAECGQDHWAFLWTSLACLVPVATSMSAAYRVPEPFSPVWFVIALCWFAIGGNQFRIFLRKRRTNYAASFQE